MKISTRFLLFILALIFIGVSIILILLPFERVYFLSAKNISYLIESIKGNYIYSTIGLVVFLIGLLVFYNSIKRSKDNNINYIKKMTDLGEIKISSETIIGLVQHVSSKFSGLNNIKVTIDILEGQLYIYVKGEVNPEINITEISNTLQGKIKEHIEKCTGVNIMEIKVIITNVSTPNRNIE